MLKVDQLEYLHCNSVVMWPEYHKIQKPIKINCMEGVREQSTCSASRYVCARGVWNVWCWSDMINHSNTHNPTKIIYFCLCYVRMWRRDVCDVTPDSAWCVKGVAAPSTEGAEFLHIGKPSWALINNVSVTSPSCRIMNWQIQSSGCEPLSWRNVKHGALPRTASNTSSHITVTLWTLPRRSNDQDIWIGGDGMKAIIFLDLLTTLPCVQTW